MRAVPAASVRSAAATSGRWRNMSAGNPDGERLRDLRNGRRDGEVLVQRAGCEAEESPNPMLCLSQGGFEGRNRRPRLLHVGALLLCVQRTGQAGLHTPLGERQGL